MGTDDESSNTGFVMFGRDILKIPCFRNTFLYSISSYIGVGLTTFLLTSKPQFSSHCGFASFMVVTLGYYTNCRIQYANQKFQFGQLQQSLHKAVVLEGSEESNELTKNTPILEDV